MYEHTEHYKYFEHNICIRARTHAHTHALIHTCIHSVSRFYISNFYVTDAVRSRYMAPLSSPLRVTLSTSSELVFKILVNVFTPFTRQFCVQFWVYFFLSSKLHVNFGHTSQIIHIHCTTARHQDSLLSLTGPQNKLLTSLAIARTFVICCRSCPWSVKQSPPCLVTLQNRKVICKSLPLGSGLNQANPVHA